MTKNKVLSILNISLYLAFCFMGLFPMLPEKLKGTAVVVLLVFSFLLFLFKIKNHSIYGKEFLIVSSLFFCFLISALLSENHNAGFKKIETMMTLFLFPLLFFVFLGKQRLNYSKLKRNFYIFCFYSCLLYAFITFYLFQVYRHPKFKVKDANFFRNTIEDMPFIGEHPIYLSIFVAIAILIGTTFYKKEKAKRAFNSLIVIFQLILFVFLILIMSKGVIIAFFLAFFVLLRHKLKGKYGLIILALIAVVALIPSENNRFRELFKSTTYESITKENSTNIRLNILECCYELILKKPILGYGVGDVQDKLSNCYSEKQFNFGSVRYNTHNQYLFVWLSNGVIGLSLFILLLLFYLKLALRNKDYIMLSILVLYSVVFLFENVLSRQSGVIFFSFIMNFLMIMNLNKEGIKLSKSNKLPD